MNLKGFLNNSSNEIQDSWQFTPMSLLENDDWKKNTTENIPLTLKPLKGLLFLQGKFCEEKSTLPVNVRLEKLNEEYSHLSPIPLVNLNLKYNENTYWLKIEKNVDLEIHWVNNANEGEWFHPRLFIEVAKGVNLNLVERYFQMGNSSTLQNSLINLVLKDQAQVEHVIWMEESQGSSFFRTTQVDLDKDANYHQIGFSLQGKILRHENKINLRSPGATAYLKGFYAFKNEQHGEVISEIIHHSPHTQSEQLFKGLLTDRAHGVFYGKVGIKPLAEKVTATQLNRNILLTRTAHVDTKPILEIAADDVKCSHGATVGQLDEEALFYLRSRGINKTRAHTLLIHAFTHEVLQGIKNEKLKSSLATEIHNYVSEKMGVV